MHVAVGERDVDDVAERHLAGPLLEHAEPPDLIGHAEDAALRVGVLVPVAVVVHAEALGDRFGPVDLAELLADRLDEVGDFLWHFASDGIVVVSAVTRLARVQAHEQRRPVRAALVVRVQVQDHPEEPRAALYHRRDAQRADLSKQADAEQALFREVYRVNAEEAVLGALVLVHDGLNVKVGQPRERLCVPVARLPRLDAVKHGERFSGRGAGCGFRLRAAGGVVGRERNCRRARRRSPEQRVHPAALLVPPGPANGHHAPLDFLPERGDALASAPEPGDRRLARVGLVPHLREPHQRVALEARLVLPINRFVCRAANVRHSPDRCFSTHRSEKDIKRSRLVTVKRPRSHYRVAPSHVRTRSPKIDARHPVPWRSSCAIKQVVAIYL